MATGDRRAVPVVTRTRAGGVALLLAGLVLAAPAAPADVPAALASALAAARVAGPVAAWCAGAFRAGGAGAYAVAVGPPGAGGRYLVVEPGGRSYALAAYANPPEVRCLDPAGVASLNRTIATSETIEGAIRPRWPAATVCGFVEHTRAVCWQHSPPDDAFVEVGGWTT